MGRVRPAPVEAFKSRGADFVVDTLEELVAMMNKLTDAPLLKPRVIRAPRRTKIWDDNPYAKDTRCRIGTRDATSATDRPHRLTAPHPDPGRTADRRQSCTS